MARNVVAKRCKTSHEHEDDQINRLPEEILIAIISCLPVKDAVRTSILSSHWGNLWKETSRLDFDSNDGEYTTQQYARLVNNVCQACKSRALVEFRVCFRLDRSSGQSLVKKWVQYAFTKNVQHLELDLSDDYLKHALDYCYVYLNAKTKCVFRPKFLLTYNRDLSSSPLLFHSLKVLSLTDISVTGKALQFYLTHCPSLEKLVVWGSSKLKKLKISDPSLKLKHLEIIDCNELACLKVRNINLRSLSVEIRSDGRVLLKKLTTLTDVSITSNCSDFYNKVFDMLHHCLPQLEVLTLCGGKPKEIVKVDLFPELPKLKKLVLRFWSDRNKDFLQLVSCIQASPMLEEFILGLMWTYLCKRQNHVEKVAGSPHQFLRVVKICGYSGRPCELELVRYFTQNALALKKMVIDPSKVCATPQFSTIKERYCDQNQRDYVTQQLLEEVPGHIQLVIL